MIAFHRVFGLAVAAAFLLVFLWGIVAWAGNRDPGEWYWRLLALGQVGIGAQAVAGLVLFLMGGRPHVLHYAYGAFPVLVLIVAHRSSKRFQGLEWAVFSVAGLIIFGLMVRGYMTGAGG